MTKTEQAILVKKLQEQGFDDRRIGQNLGVSQIYLRKLRLELDIPFGNHKDRYLEIAKELIPLLDQAHFPVDLSRMTNISLSTVKMVCEMFDLKPCKKSYCLCCGKEVKITNTVLPKYCSASCRNRMYRLRNGQPETPRPIIKTCIVCGTEFEGAKASKYCSTQCKEDSKNVANLSTQYLVKKALEEIKNG